MKGNPSVVDTKEESRRRRMKEITNDEEEERMKNIGDILESSDENDHGGEKNAYQGEKMTKTSFVHQNKEKEDGQLQQQQQPQQQQQQQQPQDFFSLEKKMGSVKMPQTLITFSDDKNRVYSKPGPEYDQVTAFNQSFLMVN